MLLNIKSYYSLRFGTMSVEELVKGMLANGYDTAVLTDINNSTGSLEFLKACREHGLNGLAGMEFRSGDELLFIAIANCYYYTEYQKEYHKRSCGSKHRKAEKQED